MCKPCFTMHKFDSLANRICVWYYRWRYCGSSYSSGDYSDSTHRVQTAQEEKTTAEDYRGDRLLESSEITIFAHNTLSKFASPILFSQDFGIDPMFLSGPKKPQYKSEKHTPLQTDEWEISPQQVIVGECLGEGAFGEVYKGTVTGPLSNPKLQRLMKSNICITVAIKLLKCKPHT